MRDSIDYFWQVNFYNKHFSQIDYYDNNYNLYEQNMEFALLEVLNNFYSVFPDNTIGFIIVNIISYCLTDKYLDYVIIN